MADATYRFEVILLQLFNTKYSQECPNMNYEYSVMK